MFSFKSMSLLAILSFLLISFSPQLTESVAVMSIDLGAEFMKIAIVKPGVPMEIVLNKESRRKTPLAVSLRSTEREFGEMALQQSIKNPKTAYLYLTQILAKSLDNPAVVAYKEKYPFYDIREDPTTKTIYFQHDETTIYTPEELLAMILDYARELAADFGEQSIDAAVIAVPAYFNQAERKSVLRAAELANLKVLQLINTNIAAGLNYGVFRRKDFNNTGTTLMFFDMGSSGITATVATFHLIKYKDDYEANPQLVVRGIGFDRELGGNLFTLRLAKHLAKLFLEKTKKDVFKNPKAIIKLYKEAERVKNVLSANADHMAQVESLMDDVDFKAKVTREEFETMCADLFERVKKPVQDAIKSSEILPEELTSVILVGGGTRIPKVQDELLKATQKKELGKNLNTDEAPALGAVYQAAFQSKGYKVKKFYIKDVNVYPIVVDFERFVGEGEEKKDPPHNMIRRVLFDKLNPYPQKKVMTFSKHIHNFDFRVNYGDLSFLDEKNRQILGPLNLTHVKVNGVDELFGKHEAEESKGIKVHFKIDDSGIVILDKIDVAFEKPLTDAKSDTEESTLSKLGNTISSFFTSKDNADDKKDTETIKETTQQTETTTPSTETTAQANATTASSNNSTDSLKNATLVANVTIKKEDVKFESDDLDLISFDKKKMDEARAKLQAIKEKEKEKRKRAAAINSLEAFIFDTRDKLTQDEFVKCSTDEERQTIQTKIDEADNWLSDSDDSVATKIFTEKLNELKAACKDVTFRLSEKRLRPKKLDELKDILNKSSEFLNNVRNLTGEAGEAPLTETEWNTLDKLINSTKDWRVIKLNEQAKLKENEHPRLLSNDINDKIEALKREVNYLVSKIKYFRPKTTKKPATVKKSNSTDTENKEEKKTKTDQDDDKDLNNNDSEDNKRFDNENASDNENQENKSNKKKDEDYFNKDEDDSPKKDDEKNNDDSDRDEENSIPPTEKSSTTNNPEL